MSPLKSKSSLLITASLCSRNQGALVLMNSFVKSFQPMRCYSTEVKVESGCPYHHQPAVNAPAQIKSYDDMPGPKGYPVLGNALDFVKNSNNISAFFMKLADTYGDMVKLTMFNKKMVLLSNPIIFEQLIKMEERRPIIETLRYLKKEQGLPMSPVHMRYDEVGIAAPHIS